MDVSGGSDRSIVLRDVVSILEDITGDWDLDLSGGIGPETRLIADLGFESIDVVQFVVAIEQRFQRRDLPFEQLLMVDGRYRDDLHVVDIVDFLDQQTASR